MNSIYDITPFTTLDFPEHLACIVWFSGCNMRCRYCYNPNIVLKSGKKSIEDLLEFLKNRQNLLEGVVLSGGECTLFKDIENLCFKIKELGFKIKIDTNGSNPKILNNLIQKNLIDYVALDFKAPKELFNVVTKSNFYEKTIESLNILNKSNIIFEVRTTLHVDLLDENAINEIIHILHLNNYTGVYYLQNYLHTDSTLGNQKKQSRVFDKKNLKNLSNKILIEFRNF